MSLTCQNQTRLLIYLLHSPREERRVAPSLVALLNLDETQGLLSFCLAARILLRTQSSGLREKNKHGIPASIQKEVSSPSFIHIHVGPMDDCCSCF